MQIPDRKRKSTKRCMNRNLEMNCFRNRGDTLSLHPSEDSQRPIYIEVPKNASSSSFLLEGRLLILRLAWGPTQTAVLALHGQSCSLPGGRTLRVTGRLAAYWRLLPQRGAHGAQVSHAQGRVPECRELWAPGAGGRTVYISRKKSLARKTRDPTSARCHAGERKWSAETLRLWREARRRMDSGLRQNYKGRIQPGWAEL